MPKMGALATVEQLHKKYLRDKRALERQLTSGAKPLKRYDPRESISAYDMIKIARGIVERESLEKWKYWCRLFRILLGTGARIGEALQLQYRNIHLYPNNSVTISLVNLKHKGEYTERTCSPGLLEPHLINWYMENKERDKPHKYVIQKMHFCTLPAAEGRRVTFRDELYREDKPIEGAFTTLQKEVECSRHYVLHQLRHVYATLAALWMIPVDLAAQLGHFHRDGRPNCSTGEKYYIHTRDAVNRLRRTEEAFPEWYQILGGKPVI